MVPESEQRRKKLAAGAARSLESLQERGTDRVELAMPHFFYLARCADNSLYAGTCIDLAQREQKHNDGTAAKYTRGRRPVRIVYSEEFPTMSEARRRESEVKQWAKSEKEQLIKSVQ